ncbi:rRNA pseudouridine synthase [bacterium]|nr:rRNA pseudouridine synthase [bacterium]
MKTEKGYSIKLNKFLASKGIGSRRHCDELIKNAEILVNGKVADLGIKIDPFLDQIMLKSGEKIPPGIQNKMRYIIIYKPCGYLTTISDPFGRPTILELIPQITERLFPVGRLDFSSEGLLILTNDGDLAHRLTHPKSMIPKIYIVKVKGMLSHHIMEKLRKGILLKDGWACLDSVSRVKSRSVLNTWLKLNIHEGRNRIIRRMFEAVGHPVIKLKRISIAGVGLGTLKPKEWRYLTKEEILSLKGACSDSGRIIN